MILSAQFHEGFHISRLSAVAPSSFSSNLDTAKTASISHEKSSFGTGLRPDILPQTCSACMVLQQSELTRA